MYQDFTFGTNKKWSFKTVDLLKEVQYIWYFCMTGQENGDH